ncbi:hypothetical protein [Cohnella hashimotonis]|uniref:Heparin-sulfate lyase N-terminal domain-containing protein n=1 Tax=Cohnella hashimotonis TaxID=2826895 RepID=A0ABT6THZ0_9BACL|nr:hypothetical protein [Cohnella hashimotonis]MDI4646355.1 hypothetical protein [Cohnella hashimotonis]
MPSDAKLRKQAYLAASAKADHAGHRYKVATSALSRLALGLPADEEAFVRMLDTVDRREDCSDFTVNVILRMLVLYGDSALLGEALLERIRSTLTGFEYWYDAKRSEHSGSQFFVTENHVMLYRTCQLLAAQLYPDDWFAAHDRYGHELAKPAAVFIADWIRVKAMVGFSEWDSHCYMSENYLSVLNVYDLAHDAELRLMASQLLDLMSFGMAVNSYKGAYSCTQGRTYSEMILEPANQSTQPLQYLLWGTGEHARHLLHLSATALSTSGYEAPEAVAAAALDTATIESREQQSFDVEDGAKLGKGVATEEDTSFYWQNMGYTHKDLIRTNIDMARKYGIPVNHQLEQEAAYFAQCQAADIEPKPCRGSTYLSRVNKITRRTGDYMLSCAQDFRKGENGFQQHIWQASLDGGVVVFTNHPGTESVRTGRPDLWTGNDVMPRSIQHGSVVISIYRLPSDVRLPYTHAFFPKRRFDEVLERGGWLFGRKGDGYVALYSQRGYHWTERLPEEEVRCDVLDNVWLCRAGRLAEDGSFETFVERLLQAELSVSAQSTVTWQDPAYGAIAFGWEGPLQVKGSAIPFDNYPRFDNPYCRAERYSGTYAIRADGHETTLRF